MRVLVADDSENDLLVLRRIVEKIVGPQGVVDAVLTGKEAIEKLGQHAYHAVIADVHLGIVTGIDVCASARLLQPNARRILISGDSRLETLQLAIREAHVHAYLVKEWDASGMAVQLEHILFEQGAPLWSIALPPKSTGSQIV